jgi:hypothetical protein
VRAPAKKARLTFGDNNPENEARLRELILYVVKKCGGDSRFGATKLNKVLFYADFLSYARLGKAITGIAYMKLEKGPAPKRLLPVRQEMESAGELRVTKKQLVNGYWQARFEALRNAEVSRFSGAEIALVDEIIEFLRDKTAEQVSLESHTLPWQLTPDGELIPYEYIFLSDRGFTESDARWAREIASKRRAA